MAKAKSKRRTSKKSSRKLINKLTSKFVAIALAVLLVAGFGGWKIWQNNLAAQEKERFEIADQSMGKLYDAIVAEVGPPEDEYHEKTCGYTSAKFSKGIRYCDVEYNSVYGVSNVQEANNLKTRVGKVTQNNTELFNFKTYQQEGREYEDRGIFRELESQTDKRRIVEQGENTVATMSCAVVYRYFNSSFPIVEYRSITTAKPKTLLLHVRCGDSARAEHYPVKE